MQKERYGRREGALAEDAPEVKVPGKGGTGAAGEKGI